MNVTMIDGLRWIHGRARLSAHGDLEISATSSAQEQPFGAHSILTIIAIDSSEKRTLAFKGCLIRAFRRKSGYCFICRIERSHLNALEIIMNSQATA